MITNLNRLGYSEMTPIQKSSIPHIIKGRDIIAKAKTGSGKTAAFGIGLLENLDVKHFRIQIVILCPTRELVEQVTGELRKLARFRHNIKLLTLTGGKPIYKQEQSLRHKAHIVVGTPGRLLTLLRRGSLDFKHVRSLVLDEADRMMDMGFIDDVEDIISYAPLDRQTLCYSATYPDYIKKMTKNIMLDPIEVSVDTEHKDKVIRQLFYSVKKNEKFEKLVELLLEKQPENVIVFCNTKLTCYNIGNRLIKQGIKSLALHGDLEQKDRTEVLIRFSNGSCNILVATDVAARGLDISDLDAVINYDLPFETETYIHRVGRTGRAGKDGFAYSLLEEGEEFRLENINDSCNTEYIPEILDVVNANKTFHEAEMVTISINGGRKNKISAGDILGALTTNGGINGRDVGKIDRHDYLTFVAIKRDVVERAVDILNQKGVKGRFFKVVKNE